MAVLSYIKYGASGIAWAETSITLICNFQELNVTNSDNGMGAGSKKARRPMKSMIVPIFKKLQNPHPFE